MDLISIHVPKTAGVTFRNLLRTIYGRPAVRFDYGDRPLEPNSPFQHDPLAWRRAAAEEIAALPAETRVIHGHFSAQKYAGHFPEARRIVWLREPVARLISHYRYWRDLPPSNHSLHQKLLAEKWSLVDFARLPTMRNLLTRIFLRDCALSDLYFIGLQEHFASDLKALGHRLDWPDLGEPERENRQASTEDEVTMGDRAEVASLNADDIALYVAAIALRERQAH